MTKHNRKYYQSKGNPFPSIIMTGVVFLKYEDEETLESAQKGDVMLYLHDDALAYPVEKGNYYSTGNAGYLKADLFDGKRWKPLALQDFFEHREFHYSKTECPIDTYAVCRDILTTHKGTVLLRGYREHYSPDFSAESSTKS